MKAIFATFLCLTYLVASAGAALAAEFYAGKNIRFIVGFSAGGGYDAYTRMVARHISRYIPGNPTTVVENMDGAGSLIAANHIYSKITPDGRRWGFGIVSLAS